MTTPKCLIGWLTVITVSVTVYGLSTPLEISDDIEVHSIPVTGFASSVIGQVHGDSVEEFSQKEEEEEEVGGGGHLEADDRKGYAAHGDGRLKAGPFAFKAQAKVIVTGHTETLHFGRFYKQPTATAAASVYGATPPPASPLKADVHLQKPIVAPFHANPSYNYNTAPPRPPRPGPGVPKPPQNTYISPSSVHPNYANNNPKPQMPPPPAPATGAYRVVPKYGPIPPVQMNRYVHRPVPVHPQIAQGAYVSLPTVSPAKHPSAKPSPPLPQYFVPRSMSQPQPPYNVPGGPPPKYPSPVGTSPHKPPPYNHTQQPKPTSPLPYKPPIQQPHPRPAPLPTKPAPHSGYSRPQPTPPAQPVPPKPHPGYGVSSGYTSAPRYPTQLAKPHPQVAPPSPPLHHPVGPYHPPALHPVMDDKPHNPQPPPPTHKPPPPTYKPSLPATPVTMEVPSAPHSYGVPAKVPYVTAPPIPQHGYPSVEQPRAEGQGEENEAVKGGPTEVHLHGEKVTKEPERPVVPVGEKLNVEVVPIPTTSTSVATTLPEVAREEPEHAPPSLDDHEQESFESAEEVGIVHGHKAMPMKKDTKERVIHLMPISD